MAGLEPRPQCATNESNESRVFVCTRFFVSVSRIIYIFFSFRWPFRFFFHHSSYAHSCMHTHIGTKRYKYSYRLLLYGAGSVVTWLWPSKNLSNSTISPRRCFIFWFDSYYMRASTAIFDARVLLLLSANLCNVIASEREREREQERRLDCTRFGMNGMAFLFSSGAKKREKRTYFYCSLRSWLLFKYGWTSLFGLSSYYYFSSSRKREYVDIYEMKRKRAKHENNRVVSKRDKCAYAATWCVVHSERYIELVH